MAVQESQLANHYFGYFVVVSHDLRKYLLRGNRILI